MVIYRQGTWRMRLTEFGVSMILARGASGMERSEMGMKPSSQKLRTLPLIEPDVVDQAESNGYDPLPSVWFGEDAELIDRMLNFYPRKRPKRILDATVNGGRFWRGLDWKIVEMDINPAQNPAVVGDNTNMPFKDASFDVVVYDPPHIPNQGKDRSKDFNTRFGLTLKSPKEEGYNFAFMYPPFAAEAYRVLCSEGILLCKIADYVHGHRYQWAHIDLIQAARQVGFCPCDCIVKVRQGPIVDPRWQKAHHTRRQHCYWLVFRKSKKCE
jgi:hypothetical protein